MFSKDDTLGVGIMFSKDDTLGVGIMFSKDDTLGVGINKKDETLSFSTDSTDSFCWIWIDS